MGSHGEENHGQIAARILFMEKDRKEQCEKDKKMVERDKTCVLLLLVPTYNIYIYARRSLKSQ